ncbi:MAG TPA: hypothetical protein VL463_24050 [Kofleriaceae bacterium]|jgi:hypothetical protein|nr:hypothetical protein [Kofleriaceae bacterium]
MRRFLIPVFLLAATTATAFADGKSTNATDLANQDCARARAQHKTCVLTFGGETINKGPVTGNTEDITVATPDKHPSLIRLRTDFRAEIIKSAEDLD